VIEVQKSGLVASLMVRLIGLLLVFTSQKVILYVWDEMARLLCC